MHLFPHAVHEIETVIKYSPTYTSKTLFITQPLDLNAGGCVGAPWVMFRIKNYDIAGFGIWKWWDKNVL